ncbi:uncharacterized protein At5g01610-like [Mangifera indica]|uniref:uncharacterized protein At5g01610-like n=1 Tax=Mangifera indica TaxID=29780 RepID=UPI001CFBBBE7|nr:uncharacterized protein At5g01610-like [Mangifera indica]
MALQSIIFIFSVPYVFADAAVATTTTTKTAYEILEEYDFPVGLLPNGVTGYKFNSSTGKFKVYLNGTCTFTVDSYKLKYKSTIKGVLTKDKLSSLSGVKVKVWFFWLSITKVTREDDELEFSVGIASADFPVSNFNECPTCGCGLDCVDVSEKKSKFNPLIKQNFEGIEEIEKNPTD